MVRKLLILSFIACIALSTKGFADNVENEHYPLKTPDRQEWSFSGLLGTYDKAQLQRGLKVYREVCASCHSLKYVAFRDLKGLGYSAEQIKAFAASYQIKDGPNDQGEMFERAGMPTDYFPMPFDNVEMARYANNGATPEDLSLMTKARAVSRPFPAFFSDVFSTYTDAGADYMAALLMGYQDPPEGVKIADGNWYNAYFISGNALAMPPPLSDGIVTYQDGTAQTVENYARDVSAFLTWSADPHMETRKKIGFRVILFLFVFAGLFYAVKRNIWNQLNNEREDETNT